MNEGPGLLTIAGFRNSGPVSMDPKKNIEEARAILESLGEANGSPLAASLRTKLVSTLKRGRLDAGDVVSMNDMHMRLEESDQNKVRTLLKDLGLPRLQKALDNLEPCDS